MTDIEKQEIKYNNENLIENRGYSYNPWLPILEDPSLRSLEEVKGRMSVMNALINISFNAPINLVKNWIDQYNLSSHLSEWEKEMLEKTNESLSHQEVNTFRWYLEALWTLMWATEMIDDLDERSWCGEHMADALPNLQKEESNEKIHILSHIRTEKSLYSMLDLYYRLHWYCVNERLNNRPIKINEGIVYQRRKALEWLLNTENNWDDIEMGT